MAEPRFIRAGHAPAYLGMDRNRFTDEVKETFDRTTLLRVVNG